jgi:chemotaxis regulatin CheY-phosphate phosphatase CheZ
MQRSIIHQWRDWLLEHIGGDNYELIQKDTQEVLAIVARDAMEAENKSQEIIKNTKKERV